MVVLTAGTSDLPVAREAAVTAEALGCEVTLVADVGVAGIHRLLRYQTQFTQAPSVPEDLFDYYLQMVQSQVAKEGHARPDAGGLRVATARQLGKERGARHHGATS